MLQDYIPGLGYRSIFQFCIPGFYSGFYVPCCVPGLYVSFSVPRSYSRFYNPAWQSKFIFQVSNLGSFLVRASGLKFQDYNSGSYHRLIFLVQVSGYSSGFIFQVLGLWPWTKYLYSLIPLRFTRLGSGGSWRELGSWGWGNRWAGAGGTARPG